MKRLVISAKKNSTIYHRKLCRYRKMINWRDRRSVDLNDVRIMGYTPCKICFSFQNKYKNERGNIDYLFRNTGVQRELVDDALYIKTDVSFWKILYSCEDDSCELYRSVTFRNDASIAEYKDAEYVHLKIDEQKHTIMKLMLYIKMLDEKKLGYSLALRHMLLNEFAEIERFIENTDIEYYLNGDTIVIVTGVGYWKLVYESTCDRFTLYHGNYYPEYADLRQYLSCRYHLQTSAISSDSIMYFLRYIKSHDDYRLEELRNIEAMPCKTPVEMEAYGKMKRKEYYYLRAKNHRYAGVKGRLISGEKAAV